eukprot:4393071-Amphidinium_carterae.1
MPPKLLTSLLTWKERLLCFEAVVPLVVLYRLSGVFLLASSAHFGTRCLQNYKSSLCRCGAYVATQQAPAEIPTRLEHCSWASLAKAGQAHLDMERRN